MREKLHLGYFILGFVIAVVLSRLYVYQGEDINIYFYGHMIHHLYYGIILLIFSFLLLSVWDISRRNIFGKTLSMVMGIGLGFIVDEFNFLFSFGKTYTVALYEQPINIVMDLVVFIILMIILVIHKLSISGQATYY